MVLGACSGSTGRDASPGADGPLRALPTDGAAVTVANVQHSPVWSAGGLAACVTGAPADLALLRVDLVEVRGSVSTSAAAYVGPAPVDSVAPKVLPRPYRALSGIDASDLHPATCRSGQQPPGDATLLQVGVTVRSDGHWSAKGVRLTYRADGHEHAAEWGLAMDVCAPQGDSAPGCRPDPS